MKRFLLFTLFLSAQVVLAQVWNSKASSPQARHHPVSWGLNGMGYSATGSNPNDIPTADFYEYDPNADTWTTLTDFPGTARSFAIGVPYQGKGYLGFGSTLSQFLDDLWEYDPNTDTWTQLASCPCAGRRHPTMVATNGKIYVGLGDGAAGNLKDFWVYDLKTDSWSAILSLPGAARHHPFQFTVGGQVYAGMGHGGQTIYDDWYKLDTATEMWTPMNNFSGEARVAGTQFEHGGFGYVLSGDGDNHSFMNTGEFWQYDSDNDSWTQLTPHPGISRWAPGSFVIGDDVYFFGGRNRQNSLNQATMYQFALPSSTVGLTENSENQWRLYPNPAKEHLNWKSPVEIDEVRLYNLTGQMVHRQETKGNRLELPELHQGFYQIQFWQDGSLLHTEQISLQP